MPIQVDIRKTFLYKWGKEEGLKEGKQEGLKESILRIVRVRFSSSKAKQIKKLLEKIDDIKYLKKIETEAIKAKTWDDFVRYIKNSNSKNKNSKLKILE
jgi:thermostable 8-oxoguanine DNA glycosylase